MRMTRPAAAFGLAAATCAPAAAQTITLETDSLPTTQAGWSFVTNGLHNGYTEAEMFTVTTEGLSITTMPEPAALAPGSVYAEFDVSDIELLEGSTVTMTAELSVQQSVNFQFNYGGTFGIGFGDWSMSLGFTTTGFSSSDLSFYAFDTRQPMTLEMVTVVGSDTYDLFVNGEALFTGESLSTALDSILVGDGTGTANAAWTLESFSVEYTLVPAPGAAAALAGLGILGARRRR